MRNISVRYFSQVVCLMAFLVFWGCKEGATGKVPDKVEDEKELSSDSGEQDQISAEPWVLNIEEATLNNPHYRIVTTEMAILARSKKHSNEVCPACGKEGHEYNARFCKFCGEKL